MVYGVEDIMGHYSYLYEFDEEKELEDSKSKLKELLSSILIDIDNIDHVYYLEKIIKNYKIYRKFERVIKDE
jgi:hypothetical protein